MDVPRSRTADPTVSQCAEAYFSHMSVRAAQIIFLTLFFIIFCFCSCYYNYCIPLKKGL